MKKIMIALAAIATAVSVHAAAVGWSLGGNNTSYANDAYMMFVIGQNNVESIATVTALLDAGSSIDSYAFGSGAIAANGNVNMGSSASGKTLDAGTYTAFFVVFDSATPTAGSSNYAVVSGASTLTKTVAATAANVTFAAGSAASILNNTDNWKSYGAVPEPTSGLLLLLGVAGLALKRKRA